ncbi:hypothetical protein DMN91_008486 [Ooceraea biroi]|uniref:Mos1 transposase HTH domain-containing protein n=1 Tax=Ooceraea biroi TaxID=2015173 RepID=A0A3L8DHN3_OOCBI|nr:hypothetical protein DMN91_008486 [Ooceraea biroi]
MQIPAAEQLYGAKTEALLFQVPLRQPACVHRPIHAHAPRLLQKVKATRKYRPANVSETARNINAVFGEGSTTKATVGNWFKNFRDGDFSLANEPRGRPKTKVDNDHLRAVVESDPSQSTRELASIFNVSIPTILVHLAAIGRILWRYTGARASGRGTEGEGGSATEEDEGCEGRDAKRRVDMRASPMGVLRIQGAASSAASLEYKIVFETLGVLLPLPSLTRCTTVAGATPDSVRIFGLWAVPCGVPRQSIPYITIAYTVYRMPQAKYTPCRIVCTSSRAGIFQESWDMESYDHVIAPWITATDEMSENRRKMRRNESGLYSGGCFDTNMGFFCDFDPLVTSSQWVGLPVTDTWRWEWSFSRTPNNGYAHSHHRFLIGR